MSYQNVFTEHGVTMLSSVLRSDVAIEASILIVRAFVAIRQLVLNPPTDRILVLETQMKELREYIEDVFKDYNDIHEDTSMQLKLLNESLAELQVKHKGLITDDSHIRVGFTSPQYRQQDKR